MQSFQESTTLVVYMPNTRLLGSLEQKIMDILWKTGRPQKPAEVLESLGDKHAYTTIMTELKRMTDKKLLSRKLIGRVYFYTPIKSKESIAKNCLCGHFNKLVDSYGELAISQFVDAVKQNHTDLKLLKQYLKKNT
ncbi:MAG: Transcriptional repressor, CopY family [Candidatus Shapirobacteria bacterium GW2011_GWE2_38_30]|uniref:Transcriptional repressor, CopY family n=2 Tax=Candidatus Shapironibacteriota TaxID=1752721 RepID=A0A0G0MZV2_9BACT|nr:MAG: Transcriptional repressor, CopY family [Candidatus Shapirobacteria bacterium GW2011_GWE2_38_30]